jgi:uncharacterized membrane protein
MTDTRDLLDASPSEIPLEAGDLAAAIDACLRAEQACVACADADLAEAEIVALRRCAALCTGCADICAVTARTLSRPGAYDLYVIHRLLQACVRACTVTADECEQHAAHHQHCALCARACRACAEACSEVLDDEELQELAKLAGG